MNELLTNTEVKDFLESTEFERADGLTGHTAEFIGRLKFTLRKAFADDWLRINALEETIAQLEAERPFLVETAARMQKQTCVIAVEKSVVPLRLGTAIVVSTGKAPTLAQVEAALLARDGEGGKKNDGNEKINLFSYRPRVGDEWEIKLPGKRKVKKTIKRIYLKWYSRDNGFGPHCRRPVVSMDRLPKGRYYDIRVKTLLKYGCRIATGAERQQKREEIFAKARIKLEAKRQTGVPS